MLNGRSAAKDDKHLGANLALPHKRLTVLEDALLSDGDQLLQRKHAGGLEVRMSEEEVKRFSCPRGEGLRRPVERIHPMIEFRTGAQRATPTLQMRGLTM